jgi:hypothetical protein
MDKGTYGDLVTKHYQDQKKRSPVLTVGLAFGLDPVSLASGRFLGVERVAADRLRVPVSEEAHGELMD